MSESSLFPIRLTRRESLGLGAMSALGLLMPWQTSFAKDAAVSSILPTGSSPAALPVDHFPSRAHAFVWRNWQLVPSEKLAKILKVDTAQILELGQAVGLGKPPEITDQIKSRSSLTVIRRNWHLLPYDQLLELLGWSEEKLAFVLKEDDFLYHKLGLLKPKCEPLVWTERTETIRHREQQISELIKLQFGDRPLLGKKPLFDFVKNLSTETKDIPEAPTDTTGEPLRFCYSYFALYGDPLIETHLDPYPDGYLQKLRQQGVNGVWLQGMLSQLAPFPWDEKHSSRYEDRLKNLNLLVARAKKHGIQIFLYLNEPRTMPESFFQNRPELRGVKADDHVAMCTSAPEVRKWLSDSVAHICKSVPDLGGFFSISFSENPTNCWSHSRGGECPRCAPRGPAEVIAEVNQMFMNGILETGGKQRLLVWDWAWPDEWALDAISKLPQQATLMCVSEWSLPITRGGISSEVGEYCLSAVGPGPRAKRHWAAARQRKMRVMAKIQAALTWEFSAAPFLPVLQNVSDHAAALKEEGVDEFMLCWTLGGHPSPNFAALKTPLPELAKQISPGHEDPLLAFWKETSQAFSEFPYHISTVYTAPLQAGPANLLWQKPTGFGATMVGFGYDDLNHWRSIYPEQVFIEQLEKTVLGFRAAIEKLKAAIPEPVEAVKEQLRFTEVASLHWESVALQSRFILSREDPEKTAERTEVLQRETEVAKRLHELQSIDSRIGFEATNQYYYVPLDLIEKVINCEWLIDS